MSAARAELVRDLETHTEEQLLSTSPRFPYYSKSVGFLRYCCRGCCRDEEGEAEHLAACPCCVGAACCE